MKCGSKFKCPRSTDLYRSLDFHLDNGPKCNQAFDRICPNDHKFYQVCGHLDSKCIWNEQKSREVFCGDYICNYRSRPDRTEIIGLNLTGAVNVMIANCNEEYNCANTDLDEAACPKAGDGDSLSKCVGNSSSSPNILTSQVCDLKCDCYQCTDEAYCHNITYGMYCKTNKGEYLPAWSVCDKKKHCHNNDDERDCSPTDAVRKCLKKSKFEGGRYIYPNQICAVRRDIVSHTCKDGLDQINCTDHSRTVMTCKVDGYNTTLSNFALCEGYDLCSDGYNNLCVEAETGCVIHRSQLCDGKFDCKNGADEQKSDCEKMSIKTSCVRRVNRVLGNGRHKWSSQDLKIPMVWVMDGHTDCIDGKDEDEEKWHKCGDGISTRYREAMELCQEVFLCPGGGFVEFSGLCNRYAHCGIESEICEQSRGIVKTWNKVMSNKNGTDRFLAHCVRGLETMVHLIGPCITSLFEGPSREILGVTPVSIRYPSALEDCSYSYGERYVYLSCTGMCKNTACPLKPVEQSSCVNVPLESRIFSLTKSYEMTIVRKRADTNTYFSDYFACKSGDCIPYSKVCDLTNDCGDWSDEQDCSNHFNCGRQGDFEEYIPLSSLCDGKFDCRNFSLSLDECGDMCDSSSKHLLRSVAIKTMAWIFGVLAVVLNLIAFTRISGTLSEVTSYQGKINKMLILLVSLGDFLIGVYLLAIAVADLVYNSEYCKRRFIWLTSTYCSFLGALSTTGSQLSLFSMTALSISRVSNVSLLVPTDGTSVKASIRIGIICFMLLGCSILISIIPLLPSLEDYFVNGLYYGPVTLFTGMVDIDTHNKVLQVYYGRYKNKISRWRIVRKMTRDMFSKDDPKGIGFRHGHNVEFYGNDGVCLFKYLVTSSDPQRLFSLAVLFLNFVCFIFITVCYSVISVKVKRQSIRVTEHETVDLRSRRRKLNFKVSIIILTDFLCWIPFITVSLLHYLDLIDATLWYPLFSIIILPINSVINPLLYDDAIESLVKSVVQKILVVWEQ